MSARSQFDAFDRELKLAEKLKRAGAFNGASDTALRRDRFRAYVLAHGIADEPAGYGQTYRQYFEKTYGEPL